MSRPRDLSRAVRLLAGLISCEGQLGAKLLCQTTECPHDPQLWEALTCAVFLLNRQEHELEERAAELSRSSEEILELDGVCSIFDRVPEHGLTGGLQFLTRSVEERRTSVRQSSKTLDAHTRLLLRLQDAQTEAVLLPALHAACARVGPTVGDAVPDELACDLGPMLRTLLPGTAPRGETFLDF